MKNTVYDYIIIDKQGTKFKLMEPVTLPGYFRDWTKDQVGVKRELYSKHGISGEMIQATVSYKKSLLLSEEFLLDQGDPGVTAYVSYALKRSLNRHLYGDYVTELVSILSSLTDQLDYGHPVLERIEALIEKMKVIE